ncbi:SEC-C metal-binding domain-containing protein [Yersinia enterocolitica]|uniref:nuclease-related domain-containing protein n=1 Tax=Yersinia enterocolitica TaxID=630 RepID=UPI002AC6043A|nr:SEC-C domain-containing protein [Yersinia enterocolitica]HEN3560581.1 SEC-C domain-containing protein [Yersinia enterocolitica]
MFGSKSKVRDENQILAELESLCSSAGFLDIVSFFCFKDTFIHTEDGGLNSETILQSFDKTRLSTTEISTITALACKNGIVDKKLSITELEEYASITLDLLAELHNSFYTGLNVTDLTNDDIIRNETNVLIRESVFYAGEGVYKHQYRDMSKIRYKNDNDWIIKNKGFSIEQAVDVISAIEKHQLDKSNSLVHMAQSMVLDSYLPIFTFTIDEIAKSSTIEKAVVQSVVNTFSQLPQQGLNAYNSVDDFNPKNAFPIVKLPNEEFAVFQSYCLWNSLYESPFFWFNNDKAYRQTASKNRGDFTEFYTKERLGIVFGEENVFSNIDIFDGKNKIGEIDVLVVFGSIAIVIQAKSKKLTIEARKGNRLKLEEDFKCAVQDSYDQAYLCAENLQRKDVIFKNVDGFEIKIKNDFHTIFPISVISDYYPALNFQVRNFLKYEVTEYIKAPYVVDVFFIDLITELLESPLFLLDYLYKRVSYDQSILSPHELVVLSIYLKQNLYFDQNPDMIVLEDDISSDLELIMLDRRENRVDVSEVPLTIQDYYKNTHVGSILNDVSHLKNTESLKLGFFFLSLNGNTLMDINNSIERMIELFKKDNSHHDVTLGFEKDKTGLTIHCNELSVIAADSKLDEHCKKRKYSIKSDEWHGICFSPLKKTLRFSRYYKSEWQQSDYMDKVVEKLPSASKGNLVTNGKLVFPSANKPVINNTKIKRNQECPCGSGKKYKKCCI